MSSDTKTAPGVYAGKYANVVSMLERHDAEAERQLALKQGELESKFLGLVQLFEKRDTEKDYLRAELAGVVALGTALIGAPTAKRKQHADGLADRLAKIQAYLDSPRSTRLDYRSPPPTFMVSLSDLHTEDMHKLDWWNPLLAFFGQKKASKEPVPLLTILDNLGFYPALYCLREVQGHQVELRRFAIWLAELNQEHIDEWPFIHAMVISRRFAVGEATKEKLVEAHDTAARLTRRYVHHYTHAHYASEAAVHCACSDARYGVYEAALSAQRASQNPNIDAILHRQFRMVLTGDVSRVLT